jgi:hypothetical protein
MGSLPTYSGGTAPELHRLPCYALAGTRAAFVRTDVPASVTEARVPVKSAQDDQDDHRACDDDEHQHERHEHGHHRDPAGTFERVIDLLSLKLVE